MRRIVGSTSFLAILLFAALLAWPAIRADVNDDDRAPIRAVEKLFDAFNRADLQGVLDACAYPLLVREIPEQPGDKAEEDLYETSDKARSFWKEGIEAFAGRTIKLFDGKIVYRFGALAVVTATLGTGEKKIGPCLFVVVALRDGWHVKEIMVPM